MYSFEYNYEKVVIKWKTYNADDETLGEFGRKAKSFTTKELAAEGLYASFVDKTAKVSK